MMIDQNRISSINSSLDTGGHIYEFIYIQIFEASDDS